MEKKWDYCYPSGLEKTLCKWDIYVCPAGHERVNVTKKKVNVYICLKLMFISV